jgi:signal transduction histidine kinase/ligand-binding sensor domain-containing protein
MRRTLDPVQAGRRFVLVVRMVLLARILFAVVLGALLATAPLPAASQVLPFTYFTPDREINPLPSAEVHRVYQDGSGFIWIAIYSSGLARYDGGPLQIISTEDGLRDLNLWDIAEDAQGYLWVASNGGLVVSEKRVSEMLTIDRPRFRSSVEDVELLDVGIRMNNLATSPDGSIWVGTEADGLVRYQWNSEGGLSVDSLAFRDAAGSIVPVQSILQRRDGLLWVALADRRIVALDSSKAVSRTLGSAESVPDENVNLLYEDDRGVLYAGTATGGVYRFGGAEGQRFVRIVEPLGSNVSSILRDAGGDLWVGTQGSGLMKHVERRPRVLSRSHGLLSETVHHLFQDEEGNVWISQTGGLARLRANYAAFENYTSRATGGQQPVLPANAVNAVIPSTVTPCTIWAATPEAGIACIRDDGTSRYVQERDGLHNDWVNALGDAGAGGIWAGTLRGINRVRMSPRGEPEIESFGGASILAIRALKHGSETIQWFPAFQSVYARVGEEWFIFRDESGLPSAVYQSVEIDPEGHLLLGTRDRGLFRSTIPISRSSLEATPYRRAALSRSGAGAVGKEISQEVFRPLEVRGELLSPQIEDMQRIGDRIWIATPAGISVMNGNTFEIERQIDRASGMPAENVISMALDERRGLVWAGTNRGLVALGVQSMEVVRVVSQQDGLVNNEGWFLGSVSVTARGDVLYGTANGLSHYRPDLDVPVEVPPRVVIREIARVSGNGRSNEVVLEYRALTFADEKRTQYRTRLAGYESEWSAPTTEARLRYTNLPALFRPRTYTLEVVAANASGIWSSEPATYSFSVRPPWWLTWWAAAIYMILLGVTAILAHTVQHGRVVRREREQARLREAELRAEAAQAQSAAAESRSRALVAENERKAIELQKARELERAFYELKHAQARLVQAEKMASLGRLAAGIAHEIKNPLNFVNNFAALSADLVDELREVLDSADAANSEAVRGDVEAILSDLQLNTSKIREHGKRTDGIVRSMLMHSRGTGSDSEAVNVNGLVDEYLNLAYHGMRAEQPGFNTTISRDFDISNPSATLIPQEIGRVLINLLNNAFYAVHEKQRITPGFQPEVAVTTRVVEDDVEITVRDNGPGIPAHIRERIFEPFFTTKPTGEGTGLGLSLSYDIITQGHGGRLGVESRQGDFTEFTITLPMSSTPVRMQNGERTAITDEESMTP